MDKTLLIIGCKKHSLGYWIKNRAVNSGWTVHTAGIAGEDWYYDAKLTDAPIALLEQTKPRSIVFTAGINDEFKTFGLHSRINCQAPVEMLSWWARIMSDGRELPSQSWLHHFVAISSNSARIPRAGSWMYCASKAALSMAIQCMARSYSKVLFPMAAYVYEPGFMEGTPMSEEYEKLHDVSNTPLHRIPSGFALDPRKVASLIVDNLSRDGKMLTGTCIRVDGGEI